MKDFLFRYSAHTRTGALEEGEIKAPSVEAVTQALWHRGLTPLAIQQTQSIHDSRRSFSLSKGPSKREVLHFTHELAIFMSSGVPMDDALNMMMEQVSASPMGAIIADLRGRVLDGASLSEALSTYPLVFQSDYIHILHAGEASGDLTHALTELSDLLQRRQDIKSKMISSLIYPLVLMGMAIISMAVVMGVLVPNLAPVFAESGKPLPGFIALVLYLEESWASIFIWSGLTLLCATCLGLSLLKTNHARLLLDRAVLHLPIFGQIYLNKNIAQFSRTLGSLLRAGAPMMTAFTSARTGVKNRYLAAGFEKAMEVLKDGQSLGHSLINVPDIPPLILRMMVVGEETAQLNLILTKVALLLEQQNDRRTERLMSLLTPALTLLIASLIGGLIFEVMNAILSINDLAIR